MINHIFTGPKGSEKSMNATCLVTVNNVRQLSRFGFEIFFSKFNYSIYNFAMLVVVDIAFSF